VKQAGDGSARIAWIDVSRGLAIILIVMMHARDYSLALVPDSPDYPVRWAYIDPLLAHIRLPLFFLVSGMLTSGAFSAGGKAGRYNGRRAATLGKLYLLWSVVLLIMIPDWPFAHWGGAPSTGALLMLLLGKSPVWYLWAACIMFGFACAVRRLPAIVAVLLAAIVGGLLQAYADMIGGSIAPLGRCLPYYIIGLRYPHALIGFARWRNLLGLASLICAYALIMAVSRHNIAFERLADILGIALAVMGVGWATERWPAALRGGAWLGRRTLPVYIFHFAFLAYMGMVAVQHCRNLAHPAVLLLFFLPLLSMASIFLSLSLFSLLRRSGLGWTMGLPGTRPARKRGGESAPLVPPVSYQLP
jgi:uncharacterized membrane protein YcfT